MRGWRTAGRLDGGRETQRYTDACRRRLQARLIPSIARSAPAFNQPSLDQRRDGGEWQPIPTGKDVW